MDNKKKSEFVRRMGKKKLGLIKRQHMDGGGLMGLLGMGGGSGGTGFSPVPGTNAAQINTAYNQNQTALGNQGNLMNTLTPQAAGAVGAQNTLQGQYGQQAMGAGPNVAQNKLQQATGANVANQASLMAGQRGAGSNPGLMAREAAMQGANTQQQAAGQAGTLQAQQQIAAQQAQAQLAANQIAQTQGATNANTNAQQAEQSILQNANTANNNIQGQLANTSMQGQQGLLGGALGGLGSAAMSIFEKGGEVEAPTTEHHGVKKLDFIHKMTKLGMEHYDSGGEIAVPQVASENQVQGINPAQQAAQGGFSPGDNKGAEALAKGADKMFAKQDKKPVPMGITSAPTSANITGSNNPFVQSNQATVLAPVAGGATDAGMMAAPVMAAAQGGEVPGNHFANYFMAAQGGKVPAMVSPGEVYLTPEKVHAVVHQNANPLEIGEHFQGQAKVKGDSLKNDTIPKDLEEGGVVIDREHVMSPEKAALFVHRAIAKKKVGRK
jgi:hypothetical protein